MFPTRKNSSLDLDRESLESPLLNFDEDQDPDLLDVEKGDVEGAPQLADLSQPARDLEEEEFTVSVRPDRHTRTPSPHGLSATNTENLSAQSAAGPSTSSAPRPMTPKTSSKASSSASGMRVPYLAPLRPPAPSAEVGLLRHQPKQPKPGSFTSRAAKVVPELTLAASSLTSSLPRHPRRHASPTYSTTSTAIPHRASRLAVSLPGPPSPRTTDDLDSHMALRAKRLASKVDSQSPSSRQAAILEEDDALETMSTSKSIRGRVKVFCTAEKYDKELLKSNIQEIGLDMLDGLKGSNWRTATWDDDLLHVCFHEGNSNPDGLGGDAFFFEWGVTVFWGLDMAQEQKLLQGVVRAAGVGVGQLAETDIEDDEFEAVFTAREKPRMENDTIVFAMAMLKNTQVRLATSYALAQSTKLSIFEERITKHTAIAMELPRMLAEDGTITYSRTEISKLIGRVFLENCAVNLLSTVLDTPEFFWEAPDSLQTLYDAVCSYLDVEQRIQVLNARFEVLHSMLDMLRDHQNNEHSSHLEWIVIVLIVVEIGIGVVEIAGLAGLFGHGEQA
ncbi:hypothetical protein CYMTET_38351 [Cymbomonas tetramitiformis]|uniref:DUF155 domain-containing protein n=1 Tax=Cymbomonas tetramitiformis TaxID=36881 RepID=A0AAE0F516_9CHLO|nr:hypothetical protein CYMTET_38351 [Cymbomonas tetramitiformis]